MNKEKLLKWISTEIEKENQKCDNAKSVKIQDNHLAIILGIDKVKEYIQSEPEETCHGCRYNTGKVEVSKHCFTCKRGYPDEYEKAGE
jgi:hypothetical protein